MASSELTDLTAVTTIGGDEVLYIVDNPGTTPVDRKITVTNLTAGKQDASAALTDLAVRSAPATSGLPAIMSFPETTTNGTSAALLIGPNSAAANYNVTLPPAAGTLATTADIAALPVLAAADPTEVQLVTAGATTTLTLLSTVARAPQYAVLASNSADVNNSTTMVDCTGLVLALAASAVYEIECFISYQSGVTADFKMGWTVPSGATGIWSPYGVALAGTSEGDLRAQVSVWTGALSVGAAATGTAQVARPAGLMRTTSAGNLQFQFAQSSLEVVNTSVRANSFIKATRIS